MSFPPLSAPRSDSPPLPIPVKSRFVALTLNPKRRTEQFAPTVSLGSLSPGSSAVNKLQVTSPRDILNEGELRILEVFRKILDLPPEVKGIPEDLQRELEAAKELEKTLATTPAARPIVTIVEEEPGFLEEDPSIITKETNPYLKSLELLKIAEIYLRRGNLDKVNYVMTFALTILPTIKDSKSQNHILEIMKEFFQKIDIAKESIA